MSTEPIATSTRHEPAIAAADPIATRAAMPAAATATLDRSDGERFVSGGSWPSGRPGERVETFAEVSGAAETALSNGTPDDLATISPYSAAFMAPDWAQDNRV
jgi:hypothetical protein